MAREPKKLNLKSKINIETVDKEEIQIKKQENLKRAPKKLNLKSKIETKEKGSFDDTFIPTPELDVEKELDRFIEETLDKKEPELKTDNKSIEDTLDKVLVETVEEMKTLNEQKVQEEMPDDAIEQDNEVIEDTIDFSTNEEDRQYVLNELTSELEQLSEVKEDEVTTDEDIVDNESEDIIDLPQVTADAAPVEIPEEKIEKKSSNVSLPDAETIALLKELVIQNNMAQMNAPVRRRRNATEEEMEIEVATHLNGNSAKEETDNLSTEMSEYSHGLSNEEIQTMPFAEILKVILKDEDVTDINFNGKDLFIQNNKKGRYLFSRLIKSNTIENFVRDIVNTLNNQFNTENPIVDCEIVDAYKAGAYYMELKQKERKPIINFPVFVDEKYIEQAIKKLLSELAKSQEKQKPTLKQTLEAYKISDERATAKMEGWIEGRQDVINNPEEYGLQKPVEWNEEDDALLKEIVSFFKDGTVKLQHDLDLYAVFLENKFKSLRPQSKQEWDTYDKAMVTCIVCCLDGQFVSEAARKQALEWFNKHRRDFLSSYSWKPSKEQLGALLEAARDKETDREDGNVLYQLYDQLIKYSI